MNKKLVNDPSTAVDESVNGLVQVHSGLNLLEGHGRVVIRSDISHLLEQKKVTLLSGGGSGHEPSQGGLVGKGMLSAAVCGSIFASPPPSTILAALRAISSPAGTLMIVTNYTGDRLTFGIAAEKAKAEGMRIEMVVVGDDTALPSTGRNTAGRRGLCGTVLVHKITGALAEMGKSLEEITRMANKIVTRIGTMSVSLSPCCLPGSLPSFTLAEDEVELGLGIHGEAGTQTIKMARADDIVRQMLNHLTSTDPQYSHFIIQPGTDEVALIVNNLGGTSQLELSIVAGSAIRYLKDSLGVKVVRSYMGRFMTSLEMAGVSLTLMKLDNQILPLLDYSTTAPGWPNSNL